MYRIQVEDDEKRTERNGAPAEIGPHRPVKRRVQRREATTGNNERSRKSQRTRRHESPAERHDAATGQQDCRAHGQEQHAVQQDDGRVPGELLESLQDPADREQVAPHHRGDRQEKTCPLRLSVGPQPTSEQRDRRDHHDARQRFQRDAVAEDVGGFARIARDRADADLMKAEVHQRFADGRQGERKRKPSICIVAEDPSREHEDAEEQHGAAGGDGCVEEIAAQTGERGVGLVRHAVAKDTIATDRARAALPREANAMRVLI